MTEVVKLLRGNPPDCQNCNHCLHVHGILRTGNNMDRVNITRLIHRTRNGKLLGQVTLYYHTEYSV